MSRRVQLTGIDSVPVPQHLDMKASAKCQNPTRTRREHSLTEILHEPGPMPPIAPIALPEGADEEVMVLLIGIVFIPLIPPMALVIALALVIVVSGLQVLWRCVDFMKAQEILQQSECVTRRSLSFASFIF